MKSLNFESNTKKYCINGDESKIIEFDPSDITFIERINKSQDVFKSLSDITPENEDFEEVAKSLENLNKKVREQIDYIFDAKVSDIIFGNKNPLSTVKGVPLYERFLNAVVPEIKKEIESESKKVIKKANEYTSAAKEYK